jgi:hypothetical protein
LKAISHAYLGERYSRRMKLDKCPSRSPGSVMQHRLALAGGVGNSLFRRRQVQDSSKGGIQSRSRCALLHASLFVGLFITKCSQLNIDAAFVRRLGHARRFPNGHAGSAPSLDWEGIYSDLCRRRRQKSNAQATPFLYEGIGWRSFSWLDSSIRNCARCLRRDGWSRTCHVSVAARKIK